jgi:hypothetical protein
MVKNVGSADKAIRWIVGLAIIGAGIYYKSWWGAIGLVPVITAMISYCPLYVPLKMNTCKKEEPKQEQPK